MKKIPSRNAFTLVEMMIVIMIITLLIGMPAMRYIKAINSARSVEALVHLDNLRQSLTRYALSTKNINGATLDNLDVENPNTLPKTLFTYNLTISPPTSFVILATRNTIDNGDSADTISMNQDGARSGTGSYSGIH